MTMSRARAEGHDAFLGMLRDYQVPSNPYSKMVIQHNKWAQGFWDAKYEWQTSLDPKTICRVARMLNETVGA